MGISFLLDDGRVVPAEKDCACIPEIHIGPCWLHNDEMYHRRNLEYLKQGTPLGCMAFIKEETARLMILEYEMKIRHIAKIIREETDDSSR